VELLGVIQGIHHHISHFCFFSFVLFGHSKMMVSGATLVLTPGLAITMNDHCTVFTMAPAFWAMPF